MRFKITHFGNLLVRVFTRDRYYICEECHKVHKRDGREIRLEEGGGTLLSHRLWYGSVCRESFIAQQRKVRELLRKSMLEYIGNSYK